MVPSGPVARVAVTRPSTADLQVSKHTMLAGFAAMRGCVAHVRDNRLCVHVLVISMGGTSLEEGLCSHG